MNRRVFLRCFSGAMLALPMLEACSRLDDATAPRGQVGKRESALSGPYAKRFVTFGLWDGIVPGLWYPEGGTETSFTLKAMHQALAPYQANLLLFKGMDNVAAENTPGANGHAEGIQSLLSGTSPVESPAGSNNWTGTGQSLDQALADAFAKSGIVTRFPSFAIGRGGTYSGLSYTAARQEVTPVSDPQALFNLMFKDAQLGADAAAKARARRKSVLDGASADYAALSAKVSGEDKKRIDAHLQAIRDVEQRLAIAPTCDPTKVTVQTTDNGAKFRSYIDLMVLAFSCDLTRIFTHSYERSGGGWGIEFPWIGVNDDLHDISHQAVAEYYSGQPGSGTAMSLKIHQWHIQEIAYFVSQLKATTTPEGNTLFDETIIMQASEHGFDHSNTDTPILLLAGDKTPLRTGRYLNFMPNRPLHIPGALAGKQYGGVPHNKLLVTLLHAFGVNVPWFGDPSIGSGDLDAQLLKG